MGLSAWLFGRPKYDRQRSDDPRREGFQARNRQAWQAVDMAEALQVEEHLLPDNADVSSGSRGYSLHALERAGLMRLERVARVSPLETGAWRFTLTPRGRALEAVRAATRIAEAQAAEPENAAIPISRSRPNEGIQGQGEEAGGAQTERLPAEPQGPSDGPEAEKVN